MSEKKSVEFDLPFEEEAKQTTNPAHLSTRGSSFFRKLSQSFRRSNGEKGADVETLRGSRGAAYESRVNISRGAPGYGCGCFGQKDTSKERFILIKGASCFVFKDENSASPKYAIGLANMKARHVSSNTVAMETYLGDVEYTLVFPASYSAEEFIVAANKNASLGKLLDVKVRLGHEHLLEQSKSEKFARKVARVKVSAQPKKKDRITPYELTTMNQMITYY